MLCYLQNMRNVVKKWQFNPTDNSAAKRLYGRLGYCAVGEIHLDGVYEYTDEQGNQGKYGD